MNTNAKRRGPYLKWTDEKNIPRQTKFSRSDKKLTTSEDMESNVLEQDSSISTNAAFIPDQSLPSSSKSNSDQQHDDVTSGLSDPFDVMEGDLFTEDNIRAETMDAEHENAEKDNFCYDKEMNYADDEDPCSSEEDSADEEDKPINDHPDDIPLYSGCRLTIATSMLLILTFALRHGLTGSAIQDLLSLVELHCLSENFCRSTLKLFHHFFSRVKKPMECHYFCGKCGNYFSTTQISECSLCLSTDIKYFITVPLKAQLQSILSRQDVRSALNQRSPRYKSTENIEDVYDGDIYKTHFDNDGFFWGTPDAMKNSQIHLSLQINTDGVSLFRTSRFGIWPLYGIINELPPSIRFNKENRLFLGLWFGDGKPLMNIFLTPMVKEMHYLYTQGTTINDKTCRMIILSSVADAPARSLMLNCMQFNGHYGCCCCYAQGERLKVGDSGGFSRVYPYDITNESGHAENRKHTETVEYGEVLDKESELSKKKTTSKFGIKGSTVLRFLPLHDVIKCTTIDYMHCVFLGVTKMFLSGWFDSKNRKENWSLRKHIKLLSERLVSIQPPNFIKRMPRPFEDLAHWKASEFRSFLLFFSLPVLSGILEDEYLTHWMMLSNAIYILSCDSITQAGLQTARSSLKLFCLKVRDLYGARYETFNLHCLLHLCEKVFDLGPLWAHSCFYFEGFNGELRLLFHGTQNIQSQIMQAICIQQAIPDMVQALPELSAAKLLYKKITCKRKITDQWTKISKNVFAIGRFSEFDPSQEERQQLCDDTEATILFFKFQRLGHNGQIIQSLGYKRVKRRQSFTIAYNEREFGHVVHFIKFGMHDDEKFFALIKKLQVQTNPNADLYQHVKHVLVTETEDTTIIPVETISGICLYVKLPGVDMRYVVKCPNSIEID